MGSLRDEIIEAEKGRTDLLKWKLIIVSGLGAAGLGFTGQREVPFAPFVLLLIPAVCLYVDLMCRHLTLRILVIGTFLRHRSVTEEGDYERFVSGFGEKKRKEINVFALEDWALEGSTMALSLLIMGGGFLLPAIGGTENARVAIGGCVMEVSFVLTGLVGILLTVLILVRYRRRCENIEKHGL